MIRWWGGDNVVGGGDDVMWGGRRCVGVYQILTQKREDRTRQVCLSTQRKEKKENNLQPMNHREGGAGSSLKTTAWAPAPASATVTPEARTMRSFTAPSWGSKLYRGGGGKGRKGDMGEFFRVYFLPVFE